MASRAVRIGVTGKIGSGKSTLLRLMEERGMTVLNSDVLARGLMESDPKIREKIIAALGDQAYQDGQLDRTYIASKIFHDSSLRKKIEGVVHPAVLKQIEFVFHNSTPQKAVAVESALILNSSFSKTFDYIILIDAPDEVLLDRLKLQGRFSEEDARSRLAQQNADPLIDEPDFTLINDSTEEQFVTRCKMLLSVLDTLVTRNLPELPLHSEESIAA
ncbi:MAG TPA: dephospho-CoA kinase [Candidatus Kapabacteria bacterium]|nr:dephospho-CoA kinase [Candidatus Kapabacteria bacterium]